MKRYAPLVLPFLLSLSSVAHAYDVNKDLQNNGWSGASAYGLVVVFDGKETVTDHYDGGFNRMFQGFQISNSGGNTVLRWSIPLESGAGGTIDPGEMVHVGWSTADHASNIKDMYWTNLSGNRITDANVSVIHQATPDWGTPILGRFEVHFNNEFFPLVGDTATIHITNVHFAVSDSAIALSDLNADNAALAAALDPLPGGTSLPVAPGATRSLELPGAAKWHYVVLRYEVTATNTDADGVDYVQFKLAVTDGVSVPGLPPAGVALLALFLAAGGLWVLCRGRAPRVPA